MIVKKEEEKKSMQGSVKWFSDKLGYGFIVCNELDEDVFVHYSEIQMEGYKSLKEGDKVSFDFDTEEGKAKNVNVIQNEELEPSE